MKSEIKKIKSVIGNDEIALEILNKVQSRVRDNYQDLMLSSGVLLVLCVLIPLLVSEFKTTHDIINYILFWIVILLVSMFIVNRLHQPLLLEWDESDYLNSLLKNVIIQDTIYRADVKNGKCYFYDDGKLVSIKCNSNSDTVNVQSLARYYVLLSCDLRIEKEYKILE